MYSMTGYGKGVASLDGRKLTIELKTVNHRFLDFGLKLPRTFLFLEDSVKKTISKTIARGHVDLYLTYEKAENAVSQYVCNVELAKDYLSVCQTLADETGVANDVTLSSLIKVPDVISRGEQEQEEDEQVLRELVENALSGALENLKNMREKEGASLRLDILSKLAAIETELDKIKTLAPMVVQNYKTALEERIAEVIEPNLVDKQRLATEVALYADHCAIDEEIARLSAHIDHMRTLCETNEPVGRKMDFLVQEFNREANTIGSKANYMQITNCVLSIKNEIEKIREQAANIE